MNRHKLFVYGTLRPSKEWDAVLHGYVLRDYGKFPYITEDGYVYDELCCAEFTNCVFGNVVEVSDEELEQLDIYEGVAKGYYSREKVIVLNKDFDKVECWVYVGRSIHSPVIGSGDWYNRG